MNWRTILNTNLETEPLAHNTHNTQNPTLEGNCADIADIAYRGTNSKSDQRPFELMRQIFTAGGLLLLDNGQTTARRIPPELIPAIREHKPAILRALQSVYDLAPQISPELIAAIWRYSFNPQMTNDEQNKWENILFLADLARDHPEVIWAHCTEPPIWSKQP
jgi:hypothetical protein